MNRPNESRGVLRRSVCILLLGVLSGAHAADTEWGISLGGGHSDNITRVDIDEQSESMASAGLDAAIFQDSSRLYANLLADLSYVEYLDDTYDSEVVGNADAQLYWRIAPERFEWWVRDNFGQVSSDPFSPSTPDTRENINFFSTGPNLTTALGDRTRARVFGRYSNVDYEETPADNERYGVGIALIRQLSTGSYLSLNAQGERVSYSDDLDGDYDMRQSYLRYRLGGERTEVVLEAGYNDIVVDGESSHGGPLARLDVSRELTAASTVIVSARYELTDPAVNFRSLETLEASGAGTGGVIPGSEPYESIHGGVTWRFVKLRTGLHAGVSYNDENHLNDSTLDRVRTSAHAGVSRRITARLSAEISGEYSREDFEIGDTDYDETVGRFYLSWGLGRRLSANFRYEYFMRDSQAGTDEYRENRFWLQLRFGTEQSPLRSRQVAPAESW